MNCATCGGPVVKNGPPTGVGGDVYQFYRCEGACRLGGWRSVGDDPESYASFDRARGPVFETLKGTVAAAIARTGTGGNGRPLSFGGAD